jgi:hypothetical protein
MAGERYLTTANPVCREYRPQAERLAALLSSFSDFRPGARRGSVYGTARVEPVLTRTCQIPFVDRSPGNDQTASAIAPLTAPHITPETVHKRG